jgi:hypothetical protein
MLHSKLLPSKLSTISCINNRFHDMLVIFQHIYDRINPQKHHYKALHHHTVNSKVFKGMATVKAWLFTYMVTIIEPENSLGLCTGEPTVSDMLAESFAQKTY